MDKIILSFLKVGMLIVISTLSWGFVTMKLWNWFLLTVFSLPEICFSQGIAMSVFFTLFNKTIMADLKPEYYKEDKNTRIISSPFIPWVYLLTAYIIHLCL